MYAGSTFVSARCSPAARAWAPMLLRSSPEHGRGVPMTTPAESDHATGCYLELSCDPAALAGPRFFMLHPSPPAPMPQVAVMYLFTVQDSLVVRRTVFYREHAAGTYK